MVGSLIYAKTTLIHTNIKRQKFATVFTGMTTNKALMYCVQ